VSCRRCTTAAVSDVCLLTCALTPVHRSYQHNSHGTNYATLPCTFLQPQLCKVFFLLAELNTMSHPPPPPLYSLDHHNDIDHKHSLTHSPTTSITNTHSLTHPLQGPHQLTLTLTHPPTHPPTHSLIHPLTHRTTHFTRFFTRGGRLRRWGGLRVSSLGRTLQIFCECMCARVTM
jgi:hypothetical protein